MASMTKKLKIRRLLKIAASGKTRKARDRNQGTVAKNLPLNAPNANELAQKNAK